MSTLNSTGILHDDGTTIENYLTATKAFFGIGFGIGGDINYINLVSSFGNVSADFTTVASAREDPTGAGYGGDKAIVAFGYTTSDTNITNLVSNLGVVASDISGTGTARVAAAGVTYGADKDKGMFAFGLSTSSGVVNKYNLVSNIGILASDSTAAGTARSHLAGVPYGTGTAVYSYGSSGYSSAPYFNVSNYVSVNGVIASDTSSTGYKFGLSGAGYGNDKGIFGFGYIYPGGWTTNINLVSNTGTIATDTSSASSYGRTYLGGAGYGGDKAIFGFGGQYNTGNIVNLVSNTGVVASDVTVSASAKGLLSSASYGS